MTQQQFPGMITRTQLEAGERAWYARALKQHRKRRAGVTIALALVLAAVLGYLLIYQGMASTSPHWQVVLLIGCAIALVVFVAATMPAPKKPATMTGKYKRAAAKAATQREKA